MDKQSAQNNDIIQMIIETRQRRMRNTEILEDEDVLIIDESVSVESMEHDGRSDNSFVIKREPQTQENQTSDGSSIEVNEAAGGQVTGEVVQGIPDANAPGFTNGRLEIITIDDDNENNNNNKVIDEETRRKLVRQAIDRKNQKQMALLRPQVQPLPRDERFLPVISGEWPEVGEWDVELAESADRAQSQDQTRNQPQNTVDNPPNEVAVISRNEGRNIGQDSSQNVSQVAENNFQNFTRGFDVNISQDNRGEGRSVQSRLGAIPKTKKKKYNPRRHLTMEDFPDYRRNPSPEYFGPGNVVNQRRDEQAFNANFSGARSNTGAIRNNFRDRNETDQPWARPGTSRNNQWSTQAIQRQVRQEPLKITGTKYMNLNAIPTDDKIDPPPGKCFSCWQIGHIARNCPRPAQHMYCTNCGRRGVKVNECPRCRDAYLRAHPNNNNQRPSDERRYALQYRPVEEAASNFRAQPNSNQRPSDDRRYALQYRPVEEAVNNDFRNNQMPRRISPTREHEVRVKEQRAIELLRSLEGLPVEDKARILRQIYGEK